MNSIPRPEHPKPQYVRESWINLNGSWDFEIDHGNSGKARGLDTVDAKLNASIIVPFCPESKLSGVEYKDFMSSVWYQKKVTLTKEQIEGNVFLHIGACDYWTYIYVNGEKAGYHKGGYISFRTDITKFVVEGENVITINAKDDTRDPMVPRGKQSEEFYSHRCDYTRTTGIWQTVWLEFTPKTYCDYVTFDGDIQTGVMTAKCELKGTADLTIKVSYEGKPMAEETIKGAHGNTLVALKLAELYLWEPGFGRLYDVDITFGEDHVKSYNGMRNVELSGYKFLINGKSVFQRLILDQGFNPEGIYTSPTVEFLYHDIDMSMAMGFNGARPHEKIFEEQYLYYADKKGYLLWGEYPNWGLNHTDPMALYSILPEWEEELRRDKNHPAIIGWCPFNETWDKNYHHQYDDLLRQIYRTTKAIDPYRPCIDTSGNYHVETDIFDVHDYNQDPVSWKEHYDQIIETGKMYDRFLVMAETAEKAGLAQRYIHVYQKYTGGPAFVSEYGGIRWTKEQAEKEKNGGCTASDPNRINSWGYGKDVENAEAFKARFKGLADALLDNPCMFGLCYTQLTDVEQEQNGLYTYEREAKFDPEWVKSVMSRKAAIED